MAPRRSFVFRIASPEPQPRALSRTRVVLRAGFALCAWFVASAVATTVVPPKFGALVNGSDYIVHGVTRSVTAEKRVTAHGFKIVTHVEFDVTEVVAGTPPARVVLEMLGGKVGDEEMAVEGMPRFETGNEDILFVSGNGRTICPLYGMMYGRYAIEADPATGRKYVTRGNGLPLLVAADVSAPLGEGKAASSEQRAAALSRALGPEEFIRQIKAALTANARSQAAK